VGEQGTGIHAFDNGRPVTWPYFEVDEITQLFQRENTVDKASPPTAAPTAI
jgi:hypothetical protein